MPVTFAAESVTIIADELDPSDPDPVSDISRALAVLAPLRVRARDSLRAEVAPDGRIDPDRLDAAQTRAHGLAWLETTYAAITALHSWAERLEADNRRGELETAVLTVAAGEALDQILGGMPIGPGETVRPRDFGLDDAEIAACAADPSVEALRQAAAAPDTRHHLVVSMIESLAHPTAGHTGLDADMEMIRDQFCRYVVERIAPEAQDWHLNDALVPDAVVAELAEMGVFALTIPEAHGGLEMSKTAMCVVSEELSRGWLGVGSLATRTEIAAELILGGGTEAQKARWLPALAAGEVLPAAVFTEPDTGSNLGALRTRAVRTGPDWEITGAKTWITHAARAGLMTVLARTDPDSRDHRGLSMFLVEKTPGTCAAPFPDPGLSGGEIEVLGYRGMKEYTLGLDAVAVPGDGLLGGIEGAGFRQLMATFESARIQTAARAVGVAQSALDLALRYALERTQFGKPLHAFPRIANKLALMAAETMMARQLTYAAAAAKDGGARCDLEAGMAKLLAARVAWTAADAGVQVHGGNGFALEYPISRVLCDARILSIFEGSSEIQAQVVARRLLED